MKEDNNLLANSINDKTNKNFEFASPKITLELNLLTKEEVYEKMLDVVKSRENQIRDLAVMVGSFNEKLHSVMEKSSKLEEENRALNEKILKKDAMLNQELSNKEIMFIRLSNIEHEYEKLLSQIQGNKVQTAQKKGFFSSFFGGGNKNEIVTEPLSLNKISKTE
jgi:chromosome segregation ATPase